MAVQCCQTCGRDTRNRSGVCNQCLELDSARRHTEEDDARDDEDDDDFFDRDIDAAIRDALGLD